MIAAASVRQSRSSRSQASRLKMSALYVRGLRPASVCGLVLACVWLAPAAGAADEESPTQAEPATPEQAAPEPAAVEPESPTAASEPDAPDPAAPDAELATPDAEPMVPEPAAQEPALPSPAARSTASPSTRDAPAQPAPEPPPAQPLPPTPPSSEARHGIGLRLGPRATTVREDLLVPLTFSGGGPDIGASYRGLIGPGLLDTRFEGSLALVANRFGHLGLTLHHSLAAAYRVPLRSARRWRFAVGGVIGESTDSLALLSWDDAHGYWVGLGFLGPSASVQRQLSDGWQLHGTAELALVGTVGRPPRFRHNKQDANASVSYYLFHPFADSSLFAPWDVQLVRFDIAAHRTSGDDPVGRGWSFGCQGRFTRASEPATILVFEAALYAAWTWGL